MNYPQIMNDNKSRDGDVLNNAVYTVSMVEDNKTRNRILGHFFKKKTNYIISEEKRKTDWDIQASDCFHYLTLGVLSALTWGLLWCIFGDIWRWDGHMFRIGAVALVAWICGLLLQWTTSLPPAIAALVVGILARHLEILDMRDYIEVDGFFRKIYPVIILGRGSLAWNACFMKENWLRVVSLGVLPWSSEVAAVACCTHLLLGFPWLWGVLLGSIYASISCPIIMTSVVKTQKSGDRTRNWPQLVCTAGGIDTALSVGVYGLVHSFMFSKTIDVVRYTRAASTLILGPLVGIAWGSLAKFIPHKNDLYATELRVFFVLLSGLFASYITSSIGWGGIAGVAILACNATAANYWAQQGWTLNQNPAATTYRIIWTTLEPMVFAFTGTYFVLDNTTLSTITLGFGILLICLCVRLVVAWLVCWDFSVRERLYVCCCWSTKSVVEAVLGPVAINTLISGHHNDHERKYADDFLRLIVQLILISTPIAYLLVDRLGPKLLDGESKTDCENSNNFEAKRKSSAASKY